MNKKATIKTVFLAAVALLVAYCVRYLPHPRQQTLLISACMFVRYAIHVSLLIAWSKSVYRRLSNKRIRGLILSVCALMIFWLTVRTAKYEFVADLTHSVVRYLWYCFYIPMVLIPLLGIFVVDYLGKPENFRHPKWMNLLFIPALFLIGAVFTNDLHQQVLHFPQGLDLFDSVYSYRFLYYISLAWYILLGLYFVVMMISKSRIPGNRSAQLLPLFIMLGASSFWIMYSIGLISCDVTVVDCILIVGLLESAIQSGLIPSNTNHSELFGVTTIAAQIIDEYYQPHYVSGAALPLKESDIRDSSQGPVQVGNTLLRSAPITAGRVVWQDDITQINLLKKQLKDIQLQLQEENTLLQAEIELKENQAQADEQNRMYDRIAQEVAAQLTRAEALLSRTETEPKAIRDCLAKICVLGSYIKRRGNLLLLSEENGLLQAAELEHCLRESLDNMRFSGVFTLLNSSCSGTLPAACIIAVYDLYESLAERLLGSLTGMLINLSCRDGSISMNIQMGCIEKIAEEILTEISFPYGKLSYDIMEEDILIRLSVEREEYVI